MFNLISWNISWMDRPDQLCHQIDRLGHQDHQLDEPVQLGHYLGQPEWNINWIILGS
jgi:hypothetical protein